MKTLHFPVMDKPHHIEDTDVPQVLQAWQAYAETNVLTPYEASLIKALKSLPKYTPQSKAYAAPPRQDEKVGVVVYNASQGRIQYTNVEATGNDISFINVILGIIALLFTLGLFGRRSKSKTNDDEKVIKMDGWKPKEITNAAPLCAPSPITSLVSKAS